MQNLESLSLESLLDRLKVRGDLFSNIFQILNQKPGEILNQLSLIKVEPEVLPVLEKEVLDLLFYNYILVFICFSLLLKNF